MSQRNYFPKHNIKLIHSGNEYFDELVKLISVSQSTLHLQVYIFDDDETGKLVVSALKLATKRGVNVYLMVDGLF